MASQAPGARERTGLSVEQTEVAAWTVADGGVSVGGARAIALAVAVAWQRRFPLWPWTIPGAPWLLDGLYRLVARLRHRLPGATPWCTAHPGACTEGPDGSSAEA